MPQIKWNIIHALRKKKYRFFKCMADAYLVKYICILSCQISNYKIGQVNTCSNVVHNYIRAEYIIASFYMQAAFILQNRFYKVFVDNL